MQDCQVTTTLLMDGILGGTYHDIPCLKFVFSFFSTTYMIEPVHRKSPMYFRNSDGQLARASLVKIFNSEDHGVAVYPKASIE